MLEASVQTLCFWGVVLRAISDDGLFLMVAQNLAKAA